MGIAKDIWDIAWDIAKFLEYKEETEYISMDYPEKAGIKNALEKEGYKIGWPSISRVKELELDGWEIFYEVNKLKRIKKRFEIKDQAILMKKKME